MEITLPSGAKLYMTMAPFKEAKELYQACLEELKGLKLDDKAELDANFYKDLFCTGLSSKKIEKAMAECLKRVTYNGIKISDDTFESKEARGDYFDVLYAVAQENISPFASALVQKYSHVFEMIKSVPAQGSTTTAP